MSGIGVLVPMPTEILMGWPWLIEMILAGGLIDVGACSKRRFIGEKREPTAST